MRRILLALLVVSLVATTVASAAPSTRLTIPGAGASIAVPASWKTLDRRTVTNSSEFRRFIAQNPSLRPFVSQMSGPNSPIKLMAFDLKLTQGFATNMNVVVSTPPRGLTPTQVAGVYGRQLKALVPTLKGPVKTSVVTLPAGKAVRASYKLTFVDGARRLTVQSLQYLVLHPQKSIVITLSTVPSQAGARNASFTAIVRSLRIT